MRRRISWLVAATTSAVVLAFVIPLCLLVRTVASDRALADGNEEARSVAVLVSGLEGAPSLAQLVAQTDQRSPAETSVLLTDGTVLGRGRPGMADDARVQEAADGAAFTDLDEDGAEIFIPVITGAGTSVVVTRVDDELMRAGVARAWASIIGLGVLLFVLAMVVADRIGRRVSTPVTDLAAVATRLHQGDLEARAEATGPEETVELAETLNRLADRIVELLAAERAAVGDLSHRLRTPVTALRLDAESMADAPLGMRMQSHIEHLQRTIDAIVRDARRPLHTTLTASCDAAAVVRDRSAFWAALAEDQGRPVTIEVPDVPVPVPLDAADVTDMLDVLVDNVFAHTADDVGFTVTLVHEPGQVVLEVLDAGPGMSPETPAEPRAGTSGLGLQIVRRTAARVGGHLALVPGAGGVHARVTLPLH
jgi:signal transduction histidine kinase